MKDIGETVLSSRRLLTATTVGWALLAGAGMAAAGTLSEEIERTFAFEPGQQFDLRNTNGSVVVRAWERDEIRIVAEKKAHGRHAEETLRQLEVEFDQTSDGLRVETHTPREGGGWLSWLWGDSCSAQVRYEVTLPHQSNLDLLTVNGRITVEGVLGKVRVRSTNGSLKLVSEGGPVEALTTNGGIDLRMLALPAAASILLSTTNGAISLGLPEGSGADLSARTTNGRIETDFPIQVVGRIGGRRVEGSVNGGGPKVQAKTTNGSIRLREAHIARRADL